MVLQFLVFLITRHKAEPAHMLLIGVQWFLLFFPISFIIEEVSFRGAIDSFVQKQGEGSSWFSAFFVSALWGLWHLPAMPHATVVTALVLVIFHCILGVPLSFAWRRSGNLAVPAAVHAFVDAFRNAL
jgi:membrane protease YdiL (CAAX protease family)